MSSLRILSFNTQLRSWAMQVGASPGYTIPPIDTAEQRAKLIAQAIVASPFDYDIVGLCEVFDEDARDILRDELRGRFPFMVTKCDWSLVRHVNGTGSEEDLAILAAWQLVGLPAGSPATTNYRLEDSGLMLFSRWPFVMLGSAGLDPDIAVACDVLGMPVPPAIPAIDFLPYEDTEGHDGDACKGVAYMRVQRDPGTRYHVFFSHTQADDDRVEEHRDARGKQIAKVEAFITACTGGLPPGEEVFFMGDLNVLGEPANSRADGAEWQTYFDAPAQLLSTAMLDLWGRRQCTGAPHGLRDPGFSASVRYAPQEQRLDYVFGLAASTLAAQHLMIDYALAAVPPGIPDVSYLSDHRPLRLELASPRAHSTPAQAMPGVFPPSPVLQLVVDRDQWLIDGQVKWYRFDAAGTYDFAVSSPQGDVVGYEVYLDTDLSRPRRQYREEGNPDFGQRFVLTSAPFLVKVFPFRRTGELVFTFRAHRHQGASADDAILLPYGVLVAEAFPLAAKQLNDDDLSTPWNDVDTKWFRLDGPLIDLQRALEVAIDVRGSGVRFGVALVDETAPGVYALVEQQGGQDRYRLRTAVKRGMRQYVQVQRDDGPTPGPLDVEVTASTDVSLLLGGQRGAPRLICQHETSGWGADDIALQIAVDGSLQFDISNDAIGDFDQDDVRDLDPWLTGLLPYFGGIEFKVIELDDTSPDDIGQETLRPHGQLAGWDRFAISRTDPDGTVRGTLRVDVDDGTYHVQVSVTTWDEMF